MADRTPPSKAQRNSGYVVSIAVNAVLLWIVHRIVGWGWLPFLTPAWADVLPVLSASIIASIVVYVLFLGYDGVWFKAPGNIVMAAFGIAVSVRMWRVFPFDLAGYAFPWQTLARVAIVLAIVGSAIAIVVEVVRLAAAATGAGSGSAGGVGGPGGAAGPRAGEGTPPPAV
jgi:hypothetical protein